MNSLIPLSNRPWGATVPSPIASPNSIQLRSYQTRIVRTTLLQNTLVVLPTGAGKTLVAAETIRLLGPKALFLVPTVLLVHQQVVALNHGTALHVAPILAGKQPPPTFDVLVSTPATFIGAQNANPSFLSWSAFRVVVFDEVHHVIKKHPYRSLALALTASPHKPRVLGLTATFTYAVTSEAAARVLDVVCAELNITAVESAEEDELRAGGYHALSTNLEVAADANSRHDLPEGVLHHKFREPHRVVETFFERFGMQQNTYLSSATIQVVFMMEACLKKLDPRGFSGLLSMPTNMKKWSMVAFKRSSRVKHKLAAMYLELAYWYDALRILIVSWEEDEYAAVWLLLMMNCDTAESRAKWVTKHDHEVCAPQKDKLTLEETLEIYWIKAPKEFSRLKRLRHVVLEKTAKIEEFRGIIFVQQRITTHILAHFLKQDKELSKIVRVGCLYGSKAGASPWLKVSKTEGMRVVNQFKTGELNLLVTTGVAEEGMDVAAANCVVRFDAMQTAVSFVQGRGRGRQAESSFVVLREREDRPVEMLAEVEKEQLALLVKKGTLEPLEGCTISRKIESSEKE